MVGLQRLPSTRPERLPRMADFARWGTALEPALGWEPGGFLRAYRANRGEANDVVLDRSPIAGLILELVAERGEWRGLPKELLNVLKERGRRGVRATGLAAHSGGSCSRRAGGGAEPASGGRGVREAAPDPVGAAPAPVRPPPASGRSRCR